MNRLAFIAMLVAAPASAQDEMIRVYIQKAPAAERAAVVEVLVSCRRVCRRTGPTTAGSAAQGCKDDFARWNLTFTGGEIPPAGPAYAVYRRMIAATRAAELYALDQRLSGARGAEYCERIDENLIPIERSMGR